MSFRMAGIPTHAAHCLRYGITRLASTPGSLRTVTGPQRQRPSAAGRPIMDRGAGSLEPSTPVAHTQTQLLAPKGILQGAREAPRASADPDIQTKPVDNHMSTCQPTAHTIRIRASTPTPAARLGARASRHPNVSAARARAEKECRSHFGRVWACVAPACGEQWGPPHARAARWVGAREPAPRAVHTGLRADRCSAETSDSRMRH